MPAGFVIDCSNWSISFIDIPITVGSPGILSLLHISVQ